ncbi:hypothetical protein GCM10018966_001940 [Streptomyces yanii]
MEVVNNDDGGTGACQCQEGRAQAVQGENIVLPESTREGFGIVFRGGFHSDEPGKSTHCLWGYRCAVYKLPDDPHVEIALGSGPRSAENGRAGGFGNLGELLKQCGLSGGQAPCNQH